MADWKEIWRILSDENFIDEEWHNIFYRIWFVLQYELFDGRIGSWMYWRAMKKHIAQERAKTPEQRRTERLNDLRRIYSNMTDEQIYEHFPETRPASDYYK
jgi:hypothetical protein